MPDKYIYNLSDLKLSNMIEFTIASNIGTNSIS